MNQKSTEGAVQMLIWAIEEIEKTGNKQAGCFAREALKCLQPTGGDVAEPDGSLRRVVQLRPGRMRAPGPDVSD